jgi:hypothetical protein
MEDFKRNKWYAEYDLFHVADETENYFLSTREIVLSYWTEGRKNEIIQYT